LDPDGRISSLNGKGTFLDDPSLITALAEIDMSMSTK